jgi:hypothetical protein
VAGVQQQQHPITTKGTAHDEQSQPTTPQEKSDLRRFTGTEQWHRHGINRNVLFAKAEL